MLITQRAKMTCIVAHGACGQIRKYSGKPYSIHPIEVAEILMAYGFEGDDNLIASAYLHDVVEDTNLTCEWINDEFNGDVADLVYQVTNPSKQFPNLSRKKRKKMDLEFLTFAELRAKALKLADILGNSPSIIREDPIFAKTWVDEALLLIEVLREGSEELYQETKYILSTFKRE